MTKLIRTKPEALYVAGVPVILFLILSKLLPPFCSPAWLGLLLAVLLACWPCTAVVLIRMAAQKHAGQPLLLALTAAGAILLGTAAGPVLYIANLICLFQDRYPVDPLSPLRIRPLILGVGAALMLTGLLETFLSL